MARGDRPASEAPVPERQYCRLQPGLPTEWHARPTKPSYPQSIGSRQHPAGPRSTAASDGRQRDLPGTGNNLAEIAEVCGPCIRWIARIAAAPEHTEIALLPIHRLDIIVRVLRTGGNRPAIGQSLTLDCVPRDCPIEFEIASGLPGRRWSLGPGRSQPFVRPVRRSTTAMVRASGVVAGQHLLGADRTYPLSAARADYCPAHEISTTSRPIILPRQRISFR